MDTDEFFAALEAKRIKDETPEVTGLTLGDPTRSRILVVGLQDGGKSEWIKHRIAKEYAVVIEPHNKVFPFDGVHVQATTPERALQGIEFAKGVENVTVVIDEFSRYWREPAFQKPFLRYWDEHKHFDHDVILAARRMTQMPSEVRDLASHLIVFALPGADDKSVLESVAEGLAAEVRELRRYEYMVVDTRRRYARMPPIRISPSYIKYKKDQENERSGAISLTE
jgi:hypothetical protein